MLGVEGSASGSGIFDKDVVLAVQDEQFSLNVRMHNCFIVIVQSLFNLVNADYVLYS